MNEETSQGVGGLRPLYQSYKHQKCFIGHSHEAPWCADIASACEETLPEFGLEPWYAAHNFDPTRSLRDKVVEMIANACYGIYDLSYWRRDNKGDWEMPRNVLIELGMAIVLNRPTLLLRHAESCRVGPKLPECLESVNEHILEFSGESSLKRVLRERLPQWVNAPPQRDWWNRYCIFGGMQCRYREAHPRGEQWDHEKLHCHISDGLDVDRLDFREVVGKVLERFNDVEFNYLDTLPLTNGYNFLLCSHCQTVRSTPFAIYRITPETTSETFIAIGMSIALEKQFEYKIPKILLTANMQEVPSLLAGYELVVAQNDQDKKNRLREFIPVVIQKVRETTWKPRPLPFEVVPLPSIEQTVVTELQLETTEVSQVPLQDFLISYSSNDLNYAEWIASQLADAGYSTLLEEWNLKSRSNRVLEVIKPPEGARRTIVVLSPDYLNILYTQPNWTSGSHLEPLSEQIFLLPIRVRECEPEGPISKIFYLDLVGLDERTAREKLLAEVNREHTHMITPTVSSQGIPQDGRLGSSEEPAKSIERIEIFCCYAREDQVLLQHLRRQLIPLQRQGLITVWSDTDINAGTAWEEEIAKHLNRANIILLLVSSDFMASEYCFSKEMARAMERHKLGEAHVVPVILRPTYWKGAPFDNLQALPTDAKSVTDPSWHTLDEAFLNVAEGIGKIVEELRDNT